MNKSGHKLIHGNNETILLVDDDQSIVEITSEILKSLNYTVLTASNGREAIEVCKQQNNIDLYLLDVVMPVMGGVEFAEHLLSQNSQAKIIFHSGSDRENQLNLFMLHFEVPLLNKPCSIALLSQTIRDTLDH